MSAISPEPAPRTILLVDDDRDVQRFVTERLEREGWRIISEKDGDWALRSFERRHVDAVILDILIPVVNGFQVAERIRAMPRGRDVAIIMLTGIYRGPKHRAEAVERYGLIDYLDKPVDTDRLVELLRTHFEKLGAPPTAPEGGASVASGGAKALVDETQRRERREVERASRESAAAKTADEGVLRGNLKRTPFPRLLAQLYRGRATGGLFLLRDKVKKIVYFRDGHPAFIKSNMLDECLGRVLVRERMITEGECEESVLRMKAQKRQQGSVLIEMGVISPHNLRFGLELQLQVKLLDVFDWAEGEYVFREDVPPPEHVIALEMSNAQIVVEGVRRAYHHDRLQAAVQPLLGQYLALADDPTLRFQDLELTPSEAQYVESIDGTRLGRDVLAAARPPLDEHGAMALLHALHCTGVVEAREVAAPKRPPTSPIPAPSDVGALAGTSGTLDDARLAAFLAERRGADAFRVLGVTPATPLEEIDGAYVVLARELHPDRFRGRPDTTLELAREAFELLASAHKELQDPKRHRQIAADRDRKESGSGLQSVDVLIDEATDPVNPTMDPAARSLAADRLFRRGEALVKSRSFPDAEKIFKQAVDLRPDMGLYHAYLGWAAFCARGQTPAAADDALPYLERAVELAPALEHPHLFLGMVLVAVARPDLAEPEFEKAMQSNPDSAEALRELRLLHMRRQKRP